MKSAIYFGRMAHVRYLPKPHRFSYNLAYCLIDLDEAKQLDESSNLFGWNKRAWFSYQDIDHGRGGPETFKEFLTECIKKVGLESDSLRFSVLCLPRVLGYCFNPISIVFCYSVDTLVCMIYEVDNTFGERIHYVIPVTIKRDVIRQKCRKSLFVSPFFDVDGHYKFKMTEPKQHILAAIDYYHEDRIKMRALFRGRRSPVDKGLFRRLLTTFPVQSFKVIGLIHYQALRLWLKGVSPCVREKLGEERIVIGEEK